MRAMWCAALASALLAACGGGGSDAGAPAPVVVSIHAGNQDKAGRAAAAATTTMLGAGSGLATSTGAPEGATTLSSMATPSFGPGRSSVAALVLRASRLMIGEDTARTRLSAGSTATTMRRLAIPTSVVQCGASGSLTISFTDADGNNQLNVGDAMRLTFVQCSEATGESINGTMVVSLASVNAGSLLSFTGTVGMENLTVVEDGRSSSLNGSLAIGYTELSATQTRLSLTVGGTGLSASVSGNGISESLGFNPSFAAVATFTEDGGGAVISSSATIDGTLLSSGLGGLVQMETSSSFLHLLGNEYAHAGTARVVGSGSALRLVVLDATKVRLDLDAQGDGTYESSTEVLWSTLLP